MKHQDIFDWALHLLRAAMQQQPGSGACHYLPVSLHCWARGPSHGICGMLPIQALRKTNGAAQQGRL